MCVCLEYYSSEIVFLYKQYDDNKFIPTTKHGHIQICTCSDLYH